MVAERIEISKAGQEAKLRNIIQLMSEIEEKFNIIENFMNSIL